MASTRKSRNMNKCFSKTNEDWPDKDGTNANKNRRWKRKLSDMLGSQWRKDELERFYEAYRKYGKDWKKVAGTIRNRSLEMVEALYNMNKAYLSLPEGTATAAGLIAMMTDHYNILEGSESEHEINDVSRTSRKPQKRGRGKYQLMSKGSDGPYPDLLQYQSAPSSYGCLSLLKRSGDLFAGSQPRAVGKRTPRIPVPSMCSKDDRDKIVSLNKQSSKSANNTAVDEGAHVAALALAEVSQRGSSPQVSRTPGRRGDHMRVSPVWGGERKNAESEMANSKIIGGQIDIDYLEGSLGSREAECGDYSRDVSFLMDTDGACTFKTHQKVKKLQEKRPKAAGVENDQFDDDREACSGTDDGLIIRKIKDETDMEVMEYKTERVSKGSRKRSCQLFFGDESCALDALQTLADLSVNILLPSSAVESGLESSVQIKEKQNVGIDEKPNVPESMSTNYPRERSKVSEKNDRMHSTNGGADVVILKSTKGVKGLPHDANASSEIKQQAFASFRTVQKRKRKSLTGKISKTEFNCDSQKSEYQKMEVSVEEGRRFLNKGKRVSQVAPLPKQGKSTNPQERPSSSTDLGGTVTDLTKTNVQVSTRNQVILPTKVRSRHKMDLQKALAGKEAKSNESTGDDRPERYSLAVNNKPLDFKEKLSHCLSSRMLRRWCVCEWFYSAIDYPWFDKNEFIEYLNHVKLGHVHRLTHVEWGVIRSSLGKPRRLSDKFLQEEREKLEEYRESVRTHYAGLRAGVRAGLPADLARSLSVGQRVIACHPKTREIHDGSILTVDRNRCRVQFDHPEIGVEFVMDVDCMPLNPLETMPDALRLQNSIIITNLNDQPKDWKIGGSMKFVPIKCLEIAVGSSFIASNYPLNTLMKQAKGDTIGAIVQAKAAINQVTVAAQQAINSQPYTLSQIQAREADMRALSELTCALDEKEALLIKLRHMKEVSGKQQDGDPIKDLEHFRKQYAMVLLQLRDVSDQVATALLYLMQRDKYHGNSTPLWLNPIESFGEPATHQGSFNPSAFLTQDSRSNVVEIVQSSRQKARAMVDVAVQAMHALKEGEDAFVRIGEALDLANSWNSGSGYRIATARYIPPEAEHENSAYQDHKSSCRFEPTATVHALSLKPHIAIDGNEVQFPSELISSCVATLFMIQTCTERQYPPAEVAHILDSAVTSLQPCCPQNLPIYREIETCMSIIKNQMLALIPTQSSILSAEALVM